jgi:hypothetical protein
LGAPPRAQAAYGDEAGTIATNEGNWQPGDVLIARDNVHYPRGTQAQPDQFRQMRMLFEHARHELRTLGGGHLGHMQRIDYIEV